MKKKQTIRDVNLKGKRVFVRVDFNVPGTDGKITDDTRIRAALPTICCLLEKGAAVILASHLGRPKGTVREELRLNGVAQRLSELLGQKVRKLDTVCGEQVEKAAAALEPGEVLLLENVRFHPGEEKNDPILAESYAKLADLFVSDAFGTAHRAHASNVGIASHIPAVAGLLMEKELSNLMKSLHNPKRPLVAIVGGSKIADKIGVLNTFVRTADALLLGGGMANTFLRAKGCDMGRSLVEEDKLSAAANILREAQKYAINLALPVDLVVAEGPEKDAKGEEVTAEFVPGDKMALDIGTQTRRIYADIISKAGTVVWNGPLGVFEIDAFARGTLEVARAVAESGAFSIIGGGDVVAAVVKAGVADKISHISTGGGATLEFWEGKELPGVAVLPDK